MSNYNRFLDKILEGNGSNSIDALNDLIKSIMNSQKVDSSFIDTIYNIYRAVDFFSYKDVLLNSLMNKRIYNLFNYNTNIEDNLSLKGLLKSLYNSIENVIKYGYAVIGVRRMQEELSINRSTGSDIGYKKNIDSIILNPYDMFYFDKKHTTNKPNIDAILHQGYKLYVMQGRDKLGCIFNPLSYLIVKHYSFSNWYNSLNGLIGINVCRISTQAAEKNIEFLTGKIISEDRKITEAVVEVAKSNIENLRNGAPVVLMDGFSLEHINLSDTTTGGLLKELINHCDEALQVKILGQAGTTLEGSEVGSYARADVMSDATKYIGYFDLELIKETMNTILDELGLSPTFDFLVEQSERSEAVGYGN